MIHNNKHQNYYGGGKQRSFNQTYDSWEYYSKPGLLILPWTFGFLFFAIWTKIVDAVSK